MKYKIIFSALFFLILTATASAMNNASAPASTAAPEKPVTQNIVVFKVPGPTLVSPVTDTVDISGQDKVKFTWKSGKTPYDVYAYLFRIYKDEDMTQQGEVYSEQVSGLSEEKEVPADIFKDGQTYTWFVKQVNNAAGQLMFSDPAFRTFKIKKQ